MRAPRRHPIATPRGVILALGLALVPWGGGALRAGDLGNALIPLLDQDTAHMLEDSRRRIDEGDLETGIRRLQKLHLETWGRSYVSLSPALSRRNESAVYRSSTDRIVELLLGLPAEGISFYRDEFGLEARSLFERELARRDPEGLLRCFEFYPVARSAPDALFAAGDLLFERGEIGRAAAAWGRLPEKGLSARTEERLLLRRILLAAALGDRALYEGARDRLRELGVTEGLPRLPPAPEEALRTVLPLPALPFRRGEIGWRSLPFRHHSRISTRGYASSGDDVRYAQVPCVGDGWVAVSTSKRLLRFDLGGGRQIEGIPLRPGALHYLEEDPLLRLEPVAAGDLLISSYVARASEADEYLGYEITIAVPQRALKAIRIGRGSRILWDTFSRRSQDSLLRQLSFNSTPLTDGERLYALGWRKSGYVDAYLVCIDLATGSALWKTPLVGNQIELTMFGEIAREPFMGGLLLEDGIVYACTNLGVVAAVRAADGRVKWVTEYRSNNERVYRGRYRRAGRRPVWDRNPVCAFEKRLLVTPLDSNSLYAFSTLTGKMLQKTSSHLGKFLLGIHEDRLVLCGSSITTLPARDLTNTALQRTHRLMGEVRARPALVREGVVYATDSSLYFQPLGMGRRVGERSLLQSSLAIPLVRFRDGILPPQRPRREGPFGAFAPSDDDDRVFDGRVKVLPDRVLVTSTYWLSCYLARPEADEGGEREPR